MGMYGHRVYGFSCVRYLQLINTCTVQLCKPFAGDRKKNKRLQQRSNVDFQTQIIQNAFSYWKSRTNVIQ